MKNVPGSAGRQPLTLALIACWSLLVCPWVAVAAATAPPLPLNAALNLGSSAHSLTAPNPKTIDIRQGADHFAVAPGQAITPAEYLAVMQVLQAGSQSLVLNALGVATGGRALLTPQDMGSSLQSLTLPASVSLVGTGFGTASPLSITGSTQVGGSLFMLQKQAGLTSSLSSGDLTVLQGGSISAALPTKFSVADSFASQGLQITTTGAIVNQGTITTPGELRLSSGIGSITNSGTINSSNGGDVTLTAPDATALTVNNTGGTIQTNGGNINIRDASYNGAANETLTGGNWLSAQLNLNSGTGTVNTNVQTVTGTVNVTAGSMQLQANTNDLKLGQLNVGGDPTIYNTSGSVQITGTLNFPGQDLAIIASQDIYTTGNTTISTSNSTANGGTGGNGGNILLVAGAGDAFGDGFSTSASPAPTGQSTDDTTSTIVIGGPSRSGGAIDLTSGGGVSSINSSAGSISGANGGNITMVAYWGNNGSQNSNAAASGPSETPGAISMLAGSTMTTSGTGTGSNGNVLMIGGAGQPPQLAGNDDVITAAPPSITAVSTGAITATGGSGGGGSVTVAAAQPTINGASGVVAILNGTVQPGSSSFGYTDAWNANVVIPQPIAANNVTVLAGQSINLTSSILASSISLTAYGAGNIGGPGAALTSGNIVLNMGTNPVTVSSGGNMISISQAAPNATSLSINSASSLSSLTINAASNVIVSGNITVGSPTTGALIINSTVLNPYSSNITVNGVITSGAVTLTAGGTSTIGGSGGSIISSGAVAINLGAASASLSQPGGAGTGFTLTQPGGVLLSLPADAGTGSLSISTSGNITTTTAINAIGPVALASTGGASNINLGNAITDNGGITLSVQGTGLINGAQLTSTGPISLGFGNAVTLYQSSGGNLVVAQPSTSASVNVTINTPASSVSSLSVTSRSGISVSNSVSAVTTTPVNVAGTLSLSSTAGNIDFPSSGSPNNVTAAGITLAVSGQGTITSEGSSSVNSTGSLTLSFGQSVQLGSNLAVITLSYPNAAGGQLSLGTPPGIVSITSGGSISIPSGLTANGGITLAVTGTELISGSITSSGPVVANYGLTNLAVANVGSIQITQSGTYVTPGGVLVITTAPQSLTVTSTGANITVSNAISVGAGGITLATSGGGGISGTGSLITTGLLTLTSGNGGAVLNTQVGQLQVLNSSGPVTINQMGSITLQSGNYGPSFSLTTDSNSNINVAGNINANAAAFTVQGNGTVGGAGTVNVNSLSLQLGSTGTAATVSASTSSVTTTYGGVTLTAAQGVNSLFSLSLSNDGDIDLNTSATFPTAVSLTSTGGNINMGISTPYTLTSGSVALSAAGTVGCLTCGTGGPGATVISPIVSVTVGGSATIGSTGSNDTITSGAGGTVLLTLGTDPLSLTSVSVQSGGTITVGNSFVVGSGNGGTGEVSLTATNGSLSSNSNNPISSGTVILSYSAVDATVDLNSPYLTVTSTAGTLNVYTTALSVTANNIFLGSHMNLAGTLTTSINLATNAGGTLDMVGNTLTDNGTVSLTFDHVVGNQGAISSSGSVDITTTNPATLVTLSQSTLTCGVPLSITGGPNSLFVQSGAALTTTGAITIGTTGASGSGSINLIANYGNLTVGGNLTGDTLVRLEVAGRSGSSIITSGTQTTLTSSSTGAVLVLYEDNVGNRNPSAIVSVNSTGTDLSQIVLTEGANSTLIVPNSAGSLSVRADQVIILAGRNIVVPADTEFHTNHFTDNGAITQKANGGLIQIDDSGTDPTMGLTLDGTPSGEIQNTSSSASSAGAIIAVYEFNSNTLAIDSSYTLNAGANGYVTVREASGSINVPGSIGFNNTAGQVIVGGGTSAITLTLNASGFGEVELAAPTVSIQNGSTAQTTDAGLFLVHTNNLVINGLLTSSASNASIQIDDQYMSTTAGLTLSGSGTGAQTPTVSMTAASGGLLNVWDFYGVFIDIRSNYNFVGGGTGTGNTTGGVVEIEEVTQGGSAVPSGSGDSLESSHTAGTIILEPGVQLSLTAEQYVELDSPNINIKTGAAFNANSPNEVALEFLNFTNNGKVVSSNAGGPTEGIALGDDDEYNTGDADSVGNVQIYGNGSIGYSNGVAGTIDFYAEAVYQLSNGSQLAVPSREDSINILGNQAFTLNGGAPLTMFTEGGSVNIAAGTTQTVTGGVLVFDSPMVQNNGTITAIGAPIVMQNSSPQTTSTLFINNGTISTNAISTAEPSFSIQGTGNLTLAGTGTFSATASNGAIVTSTTTNTSITVSGTPTFQAGTGRTGLVQFTGIGTTPITIGDGSGVVQVNGNLLISTPGNVTAPNLAVTAPAAVNVSGTLGVTIGDGVGGDGVISVSGTSAVPKAGSITITSSGSSGFITIDGSLTATGFDASGLTAAQGDAGLAGVAATAGGGGGSIVLSALAGTVSVTGSIDASGGIGGTGGQGGNGGGTKPSGGAGSTGGAGGAGGSISITGHNVGLVNVPITASGENGGTGGVGGSALVNSSGAGGAGGAGGAAGKGGSVTLKATSGNLTTAAITADGGQGGLGGAAGSVASSVSAVSGGAGGKGGNGGVGGGGGTVTLSAAGTGSLLELTGNIDASAGGGGDGVSGQSGQSGKVGGADGSGGSGGAAGLGGKVAITGVTIGYLDTNATLAIDANGATGGSGQDAGTMAGNGTTGAGGAGGKGGSAGTGSAGGSIAISVTGTLSGTSVGLFGAVIGDTAVFNMNANGGGGGNGGIGGAGGNGSTSTGSSAGGVGGAAGLGGVGGKGGTITLSASKGSIATSVGTGAFDATGGAGGIGALGGAGGNGGLQASSTGGVGGAGSNSGAGGVGGSISLSALNDVGVNASLAADGGQGGTLGMLVTDNLPTGGAGGNGTRTGGAGGHGGSAGAGGAGGSIKLSGSQVSAVDLSAVGSVGGGGLLTGGAGGDAVFFSGAGGAGGIGGSTGAGGAGGKITITGGLGGVAVQTVQAQGGISGSFAPNDGTPAQFSGGGAGGNSTDVAASNGKGGNGGAAGVVGVGGKGGAITITVTQPKGTSNPGGASVTSLSAFGGDAGDNEFAVGGTGGTAQDTNGKSGTGGAGGVGGAGGAAGSVTVKVPTATHIDITGGTTAVNAYGGIGATGGTGGQGGNYIGAATGSGGNGGNGGKAGNGGAGGSVSLTPTGSTTPIQTINVSGGTAGQVAIPPGNGGAEGSGSSTPTDGKPGTTGQSGKNGSPGHAVSFDADDDDTAALGKHKKRSRTGVVASRGDAALRPVAFVQSTLQLLDRQIEASNVLVAPEQQDVTAAVSDARVHVARGAAAFIVDDGNSVCVLALHDRALGDVSLLCGGQEFKLHAGDAVVLEYSSTNADGNSLPGVTVRDISEHTLDGGVHALVCEFSIPSAIHQLNALRSLEHSQAAHDRTLFNNIIKDAAALQTVGMRKGAYTALK